MPTIDELMKRAETLAERDKLSLSTISRKLLNDGKGLARLKAGGQLTLKTMDLALTRLSALERGMNPDEERFPAGLERKFVPPASNGEYARGSSPNSRAMSHLDRLEAEAIHIMREVAAEAENPVMIYSIGKDSSVMLHLAAKAFHPSRPPFPLLHVDTTWKFRDMYAHRDRIAKELGFDLIVHINEEGLKQGDRPVHARLGRSTPM